MLWYDPFATNGGSGFVTSDYVAIPNKTQLIESLTLPPPTLIGDGPIIEPAPPEVIHMAPVTPPPPSNQTGLCGMPGIACDSGWNGDGIPTQTGLVEGQGGANTPVPGGSITAAQVDTTSSIVAAESKQSLLTWIVVGAVAVIIGAKFL